MTAPKREILSMEDLPENALVEEVAQFFRTTIQVVRQWIKAGEFPNAYKSGRNYLIPKDDVVNYMRSQYGKR